MMPAVRSLLVATLLLAAPRAALACPVCFGQNDSPLATAMNLGIMAMLGVVVAVLSGFATFMIYLARRARVAAFVYEEGPAEGLPASRPQEGPARC
jgi:hypothetical protein